MTNNDHFNFIRGGTVGELIKSFNWAGTSLGPVEEWPASFKSLTAIILASPLPMYIAWGDNFTQIYNDAFIPILGPDKHPEALGKSCCQTFAEIWDIIGPMFKGVLKGTAVHFTDFMVELYRNGDTEECFFDFSYSPIIDGNGTICGVLATVIETTDKVKKDRVIAETVKQLQAANAETEKERDRLTSFFMEAPVGICILDGPEFIFQFVNPSYQQLFPGRGLLGKPVLEAVPEIKHQEIHNILRDVYTNNKTFKGNSLKIPLAKGTNDLVRDRLFNFIYQPKLDSFGNVNGIVVFVTEVTELAEVKLLMEESEKRFRTMVEQSPVPMLVTKGSEMIFEEINPPMLELIGKDSSIKGLRVNDILPELKGQPIMDRLYEAYYSGHAWAGVEVPILLKKNEQQINGFYNLSYKPLIENGEVTGVLQSAIDVTPQVEARKLLERAEDRLKLALLAAKLGTFDMDLEKGTLEWDERCRELFGISHNGLVTYEKDFMNGLHPEDRDRIIRVIEKVFIKSVSNGHYDVEYRTIGAEDKKIRWLRAMGKAYFDGADRPLRFIGSVLEITDLKEDEIRKNDFIGMVSHELKTPLTSLKGYLQILQENAKMGSDLSIVNSLGKAENQLQKMNALINGFLNVARLESGKIQLNKQHFDLDILLNEIIEDTALNFPSYVILYSSCTPVMINADKVKYFVNICSIKNSF